MTGKLTTADVIRRYEENGWCPVPYGHHPRHIKSAIKAARIKPAVKQCYANSQRCVALQSLVNLTYAEGIAHNTDIDYHFAHAWIIDENGKHHDLTLNPLPKITCYHTFSREEVRKHMIGNDSYDIMDDEWMYIMNVAISLKIPVDQDYEEIKKLVNQRMNDAE